MQYYSTGGQAKPVSFKEALFNGLAPDGGLYLPESITELSEDFFKSVDTYSELALGMIQPFLGQEIPQEKLEAIINSAFDFDIPLIELNDRYFIMELFHGPTFAFKDFAARFMARLMAHFHSSDSNELTILVATSGDTGSAVAQGFLRLEGIRVVILYPSGRVSEIQEKQLTTVGDNVSALEVQGSFDDCQKLVKTAFQDSQLRERCKLSSANSINIARLLPQSVYYAWAWNRIPNQDSVVFSVPSGNFGNLTAGLLAKRMGLPVEKFIAATNINDVFPKYLKSGNLVSQIAQSTISNAMDVAKPSNLDRILNLYDNRVDLIRRDFKSWGFSDSETEKAILSTKREFDYVPDPHTAVGILGLEKFNNECENIFPGVVLATAHPGKFPEIIQGVIKEPVHIPKSLKQTLQKKKNSIVISNNYEDLKEILLARISQ